MIKLLILTFAILSSQFAGMPASAEPTLHSFGPQSLQAIKSAHAGRPFVLFLWSLDCTYCQASMEGLAAMQKQQPLTIIAIATDAAGDHEQRRQIAAKLDASGMAAQRWAFGPYSAEQLRYAIDPKWWGEIPRTYWFDKEGRAAAYSGVLDRAAIRKYLSR